MGHLIHYYSHLRQILQTKLVKVDSGFKVESVRRKDKDLLKKAHNLLDTVVQTTDELLTYISYLYLATGVDEQWLWVPTTQSEVDQEEIAGGIDYQFTKIGGRVSLNNKNKVEDASHLHVGTVEPLASIELLVNSLALAGKSRGGLLIRTIASEFDQESDFKITQT